MDAERRHEQRHAGEHEQKRRQEVEELLVDVADVLVGELGAADHLDAVGKLRADAPYQVVLRHVGLAPHRDGRDLPRLLGEVLLGGVERERGEGDADEAVLGPERRQADDLDLDRLGSEDRGGVADPEVPVVGGGAVDDDLVVGARCPALGQAVRVELGVGDPVAGHGGRTVPAHGLAVAAEQLAVALDGSLGGGDAVHRLEVLDEGLGDEPGLGLAGVGLDLARSPHHRIGAGIRFGEQVVEAGPHRVAEHDRAGEEGHAEEHGQEGAGEPALAGPQAPQRQRHHRSTTSCSMRSMTDLTVGSASSPTIRPSARNTTRSA